MWWVWVEFLLWWVGFVGGLGGSRGCGLTVVGWVGSVFTCRRDAVTSTEMLRKGC